MNEVLGNVQHNIQNKAMWKKECTMWNREHNEQCRDLDDEIRSAKHNVKNRVL